MAEEHKNLSAALVRALTGLSVVEKGRTATVPMKSGGKYTYDYADLGDVVKLTRPALANEGLVALTPVEEHGDGLKVTVVLLHSSGERMDFGPFPFPRSHDAQATGSAITYYRRYALVAALGMAAGDDDDGATAKAPVQVERQQQTELAALAEHEAILSILKVLTATQRIQVTDWWTEQGLPLTSSQKPAARRLTEEQCSTVLDYLDGLKDDAGSDDAAPSNAPPDSPAEVDASGPASLPIDPPTGNPVARIRQETKVGEK